jgi:hypothetical protein
MSAIWQNITLAVATEDRTVEHSGEQRKDYHRAEEIQEV